MGLDGVELSAGEPESVERGGIHCHALVSPRKTERAVDTRTKLTFKPAFEVYTSEATAKAIAEDVQSLWNLPA
jgi:hypothetical protein